MSSLKTMGFHSAHMRRFLLPLAPAVAGGAVWDGLGFPLGWLMGAALVIGCFAIYGVDVSAPKTLQFMSHATIGATVGLSLSPDAAKELLTWAPAMIIAAALGIVLAIAVTPMMVRVGQVSPATAFYSLLPGGVIEMANIGERHGADRTTIAALHAVRVAMIVSILPLFLFAFSSETFPALTKGEQTSPLMVLAILATGLVGGGIAKRIGMPAPFLLGSILAVGMLSAFEIVHGLVPEVLLAIAQIVIGFSLGAKFQRKSLRTIPRAVMAAVLFLGLIMSVMASTGIAASWVMPESMATLVLCFSIGGMAEMILTAKILGENAAMIAAFQVVRAVLVNSLAGSIWIRISKSPMFISNDKG